MRLPLLPLLVCCATAAVAQPPSDGWISLFDGRSLEGWCGQPHHDPRELAVATEEARATRQAEWDAEMRKHWRVENGEIVNLGEGPFLTTRRSFEDFELELEYKTVALADSGIYLRGTPQVQIWDTTEAGGKWSLGADRGSGGLWNNKVHERFPLVLADRAFGEWNRVHIKLVGARTTVDLNGQRVVDFVPMENFWSKELPLFRAGPIQLQTHGGEIRWRNVRVRPIDASRANRLLGAHADDGFVSIFNGKDLEGWQGSRDGYQVEDSSIACRAGAGGNLFTTETYSDFAVRFEFQLPPAGNNGLAIRYGGSGDPAYDAFCELQILDDGHEKYREIQPWQAHGSAYGLSPAVRGYLRPTGEWNFEEVTVRGSKVRVELNGSIILDSDLALVQEPLSKKAHPGLNRKEGHFGFAGHGDPVRFRNLRIKRL